MKAEDVRQKLLGKFRETTTERVERISSKLLELERGAGVDARNEVARELHTMKGEAGMMGFAGISLVAHAAEDLLGALPPRGGGPGLDTLLAACDAIPTFLEGPADGGEPARALAARIRAMAARGDALAPPSAPGSTAGVNGSASGGVSAGDSASSPAASPDPAAPPTGGDAPRPEQRGDRSSASIRVAVERLDEIAALAGDVLVEENRGRDRARELASLFSRWSGVSERLLSATEDLRRDGSCGLADRLENDVHVLRGDTFRLLRRHFDAQSSTQGQLARLAERVDAARLIPLSGILAGLPRAARDLAKEQGKQIECTVVGGETCVDRAILLALQDPLVHLLRNAVDHGLETPEERVRAGKPPTGRIIITAHAERDLAVTVEDDGRGILPDRVRAAALRKGFLEEQQAASLSPRAAMDLIFLPGFSTRDQAGETSGRGVGLDVVRRRILALGGSVMVDATPGRGARFTLRMSQSLSLMKVLLVRVGEDVYGIPAMDVLSVGRIEPADRTEIAGITAVRQRDRLMPVAALGDLLSLRGASLGPRPAAAFLWQGSEGLAVTVDGLCGEREVAVKSPGAFVKSMRFVSGAALLEDGRVALLLSTTELLAAARRLPAAEPEPERGRRRLRILLVDDSTIARDAEAAMLAALGHDVDEARDGEEGWQKLQGGSYQALVTDVQMPLLDGIGLTRRVRASPRFARLPITIMSSLSAPEEKRRGVDAGADAYLVKGELDPEILAATLDRLCGVGG